MPKHIELHGRDHRPQGSDPIDFHLGWTVVLGDGDTPVVTGDYQVIWKVPRQIVGSTGDDSLWYIYEPSASVRSASTAVDVEIWLWRVRNLGGTSNTVGALLDSPIVIDANTQDSNESASPVVVTQYANLVDFTPDNWDSIMVEVTAAGDATGLSINVPIGPERPFGSGYHIT